MRVPPSKSISSQRSAHSSPRRHPVVRAAYTRRPRSGLCSSQASRRRPTSSSVGGTTSFCLTGGDEARSVGLRSIQPHRSAWCSAADRTAWDLRSERLEPRPCQGGIEVVELGRPEAVDACGPEPRNDIHLGDRAVPHDRRRRSALRLDVLQPTIEKLRHGVPLGALVPAVVDLGHELGSKALRFAWCPGRCGERTDSDPSSRRDRARLAPASGRAQSGECCPSPLPTEP